MKLLKLFSGEYMITEEQEKAIDETVARGAKFVKLKGIGKVNINSISIIPDELPKIATWDGYIVNTRDWSFHNGDKKLYLEEEQLDEIEYKTNPKYKIIDKNQIKAPQKNDGKHWVPGSGWI